MERRGRTLGQDKRDQVEQEEEYERDPYDAIDWEEHEHRKWRRAWKDEHPFNQRDFL